MTQVFKYLYPISPQNHSRPLFDELLLRINQQCNNKIANDWYFGGIITCMKVDENIRIVLMLIVLKYKQHLDKHVYSTMNYENFCKYFIYPTFNFV